MMMNERFLANMGRDFMTPLVVTVVVVTIAQAVAVLGMAAALAAVTVWG